MSSSHSKGDLAATKPARTPLPSSRPTPASSASSVATRTPLPSSRPAPPSAAVITSDQNSSRPTSTGNKSSTLLSAPPLFQFIVSRGYGVPVLPATSTTPPILLALSATAPALPLKTGYKFYCVEHNKHIRHKSGWTRHQKEKHGLQLPYKCTQCTQSFPKNDLRKRHVDLVHKEIRKWKCEKCVKDFQEKKDLVTHVAKHH
ncbi:hypothetical protein BKA65DRAFT_547545 [Rhexocercosporidium sp. MPI-PUGE-AT-0058]|nr:hypothetical protein BKA65DRAFT_547545 [Rhexocercosporidium sp. MPI-PUGE-AT-0058]